MSVKHITDVYNQVCNQYTAMLRNLELLEERCKTEIISPEYIENVKQMTKPIEDNYRTWSYIMYLLNKPNKKEKQKKYDKQISKLLSSIPENNKAENVINKNNKLINNLKQEMN